MVQALFEVQRLLDTQEAQPRPDDYLPPTFSVRWRSAADHGHSPGEWQTELKTQDVVLARRLARALYARGWSDVEIGVDWKL